jgi:hypothetical protein
VVARSLNERQTLIAGSSVAELIAQAGLLDVQARCQAMIEDCEHAIYEVRRLTRRSSVRPGGRGITARSVRAVARGSREQMHHALAEFPGDPQQGAGDIVRHVLRRCRVSNFVANQDIPDLPVSDCLIFVANGFVSFLWRIPDSPSRLASHAPPTS